MICPQCRTETQTSPCPNCGLEFYIPPQAPAAVPPVAYPASSALPTPPPTQAAYPASPQPGYSAPSPNYPYSNPGYSPNPASLPQGGLPPQGGYGYQAPLSYPGAPYFPQNAAKQKKNKPLHPSLRGQAAAVIISNAVNGFLCLLAVIVCAVAITQLYNVEDKMLLMDTTAKTSSALYMVLALGAIPFSVLATVFFFISASILTTRPGTAGITMTLGLLFGLAGNTVIAGSLSLLFSTLSNSFTLPSILASLRIINLPIAGSFLVLGILFRIFYASLLQKNSISQQESLSS